MSERSFTSYPFDFIQRSRRLDRAADAFEPLVLIVGGGIAGLTAALALARQQVRCTVIEADSSVCFGSRAICISRRSLEIFDRYGVAGTIVSKALAWTGGRSYYREQEILHFEMPHDTNQKFPPMVNLQQYHLEEILVQALERVPDLVDLQWGCRAKSVTQTADGVRVSIDDGLNQFDLIAPWLIACDGGRSVVRELLGLALIGTSYEGRYVIVDIAMKSARPTERLAWFDPASNPGSTILMHRQPDDVWRVDYQLTDDEDSAAAVSPENVLARVAAHLEMIGEKADWSPIWVSLYKANALSLERYCHGRVLFAGDAAHLVPIFGVRGANSSIDDADNLAWKLAALLGGAAGPALLESYSEERHAAALENLQGGMKSTEFMAPPSYAFKVMRRAVLNLAADHPAIRSLINPRQTSAISYDQSPLNAATSEDATFACGPRAGAVLTCFPLTFLGEDGAPGLLHLTDLVQAGKFLLLHFVIEPVPADEEVRIATPAALRLARISLARPESRASDWCLFGDVEGRAFDGYDARPGATYLVRPDGHVLARWRRLEADLVRRALAQALQGFEARKDRV